MVVAFTGITIQGVKMIEILHDLMCTYEPIVYEYNGVSELGYIHAIHKDKHTIDLQRHTGEIVTDLNWNGVKLNV